MDPPPEDWIWKNVVDAMYRPLMGEPHRPGIVEVGCDAFHTVLQDRLEAIGVRCVATDDLEQIDDIFRQLGKFLSGGKALPPLVEMPGVQLDDIRGFYEAAADFYRSAPWRLVPGDTTLKIDCPRFSTHTWYGVVMGQSGLVLGLALYEDLSVLQRLFSGSRGDEQMSRQATGLSVIFGEAFEIPIADLDAAQRSQLAGRQPGGLSQSDAREPRPIDASAAGLGVGIAGGLLAGDSTISGGRRGQRRDRSSGHPWPPFDAGLADGGMERR